MARHAAGDRVDRVADLDPVLLQDVGHLAQRVLRLRHRHAVARHDDDRAGILHDEGGVLGAARFDRAGRRPRRPAGAAPPSVPKPPRITLKIERFIPLHMM